MSARSTFPEPSAGELARQRLRLLSAELCPTDPAPEGGALPAAAPPRPGTVPRIRPGRHARPRLTRSSRLAAHLADALPPTLHGRFAVTAHHVTVVALLLAVAMTLAAWLVVRSDPGPVPARASLLLPPGAPAAAVPQSRTPAPGAAAAAPPTTAEADTRAPVPATAVTPGPVGVLVVHVAGRVRRPGVVELPAGSRVIDAVEAAGGARPGARLGRLNLARPLVDGEQIAVGVPAAPSVPVPPVPVGTPLPTGTSASGGLVNLNTATQAELEELPGVGPVTATSIIEWRTEHGGFSTVDELIEVSGIGEVTLAELRALVTV